MFSLVGVCFHWWMFVLIGGGLFLWVGIVFIGGHSFSLVGAILSIPPLILAGILEFQRIPAGIDRNLTGIDRDYPYLGYILLFYFK